MDSQAIANLVFAYARHLDAGDFEAVAELFREARIVTAMGEIAGYEGVLAMYRSSTRLYEDGTPRTRHVTSNLAIEVAGDTATSSSYFTVMQAVPSEFPLQAIISGDYHDEFARRDGQWQFQARHINTALLGDLSRHLLFDPGTLEPAPPG